MRIQRPAVRLTSHGPPTERGERKCLICAAEGSTPTGIGHARVDPTRASIPLHLAVNGSLEVDHTVGIVLAGDATELAKADVREHLEGVGVPVRDVLAKGSTARGARLCLKGMRGGPWGDRRRPGRPRRSVGDSTRCRAPHRSSRSLRQPVKRQADRNSGASGRSPPTFGAAFKDTRWWRDVPFGASMRSPTAVVLARDSVRLCGAPIAE